MTDIPLFGVMLWAVPRFRRPEVPLAQAKQPVLANKAISALKEERAAPCSLETGADKFPNVGFTSL